MADRHAKPYGLPFVATCAAVLPALWLLLFLLALPFQGGHPPLVFIVAILPASVSLTARAAGWLMGDPGAASASLAVLVAGTAVELAFVGAVAGVAARRAFHGPFPGQFAWLACVLLYVAGHAFGNAVVTSTPVTRMVLSVGSTNARHDVLQRIERSGDRRHRDVLLAELEKTSEPEGDANIIATLTLLEDGGFWYRYSTSPRGSRWGTGFWAKVLCDISKKSSYLRQAPGVDFALLTESFASLNRMVFERMVAELPNRPALLNPIFRIAFNNPELGRASIDRLFELLQRPAIAKCVRVGMSFRSEWGDPSHPNHRLYALATATCQEFTKADLELWLAHAESPDESGSAPLNAAGLCQFVVDSR
jgi:hypothetical protein